MSSSTLVRMEIGECRKYLILLERVKRFASEFSFNFLLPEQ
jgi:hypothetical protein